MIKCELTLCGVISRSAVLKTSGEGGMFVSFSVTVPIKDHQGNQCQMEFGVSCDGDKGTVSQYVHGRRVKIDGTCYIVKKNDNTYFNLRASKVELVKTTTTDLLEGIMTFRGKIGKAGVEEKTDKKGNTFKVFNAFSSDRNGDNVEFTWCRFLYFSPKAGEDFLCANSYIEVLGDLQLGVYKGRPSLECRVDTVSRWELEKKQ